MRTSFRLILACASACLLLLSCASPKVKILDHPVPGSPMAERDAIRQSSREVLERNHLAGPYRRDPYAAVRSLAEIYQRDGGQDRLFALADLCGRLGTTQAAKNPAAAAGCYLDAARLARPAALKVAASGTDHKLLLIHNEACAALTSLLKELNWSFPASFTGPLQGYQLSRGRAGSGAVRWNAYREFIVADHIQLKHAELESRQQAGIGGAMVAHLPPEAVTGADREFAGSNGFALPVNAMLEFKGSGGKVELVIRNLLKREDVRIDGRSVPLAANWSASLAYLYQYAPSAKIGFKAMLRPEEFDSKTYLYELAPFDPDKIPVVLVHGLMSSPTTWIHMINQLRIDPVLRNNYQALVFRYPTGYPITSNAASMRANLKSYRKAYDSPRNHGKMQRTVIIGHSMGGILSNIAVRDSGEQVRKLYFDHPVDQLGLSDTDEQALSELVHFQPNPDVERAIFIAAPHQGSKVAQNVIGDLGTRLIKLPGNFLKVGLSLAQLEQLPGVTDYGRSQLQARPDSIRSLRPDSEYLKTVARLPVGRRITYHTIAGQVNQNAPKAEGTDKLVPYWSSHLDGAASELIVDASHTHITHHPDTIEEVRRILYLHLGLKAPAPLPVTTGNQP